MNTKRRIRLAATSAIPLAITGTAALAQTAPAASPSPMQAEAAGPATGENAALADIIVTAQRRDEGLAKTPVSVAVISADQLAKAQVTSEANLQFAAPGLQVRATFGSNQLNYSLRGQSLDAFTSTRPGVLPYINEVQIGGPGGATAFYDFQSVQVLKGPQGTLFGRSATGGAVLFTTVKPTDQFGGYASASYGNYDARKIEGALNAPLVGDSLLARVAGYYSKRDGFQRNLFDGSRAGGIERTGLRGSVTAKLSDNLRNEFVFDYFHANGQNTAPVLHGLLIGGGTLPSSELYAGTSTPAQTQLGTLYGGFFGVTPAAYAAYFANPRRPNTGLIAALADQQARGPYVINENGLNGYQSTNYIVTNSTIYDLSDALTVKNIFGYTHLVNATQLDGDGTPYGIQDNGPTRGQTNTTRQVSEELQLSGTTFDDRLSFVVGGFFSDERTKIKAITYFYDIVPFPPQTSHFILTSKTYAAYGQGTFKLNDSGLAVTAGVRYTSERVGKSVLSDDYGFGLCTVPGAPTYSCVKHDTYKKVSWTAGLQQQVNPDLLLYATARRAYKSGGFNGYLAPKNGPGSIIGDSYGAERLTDAEVGAKFLGRLGGVPARANIALFYDWSRNSQHAAYSVVSGAPGTTTVNVPSSRTYGLEFDTQINPAHWLALGATFNYTHARFRDGRVFVPGPGNVVYDQVTDLPTKSGTVFADVTLPVSGSINALIHGDVYAQSKSFSSFLSINNQGTIVHGYAIADFRLGVEDEKAGWSLTANLRNAFNRTYYVGGFALGIIDEINLQTPGEPRTFAVEARLKF